MSNRLLLLSKNLNSFIQRCESNAGALRFICDELMSAIDSNILITNRSGSVSAVGMLPCEDFVLFSTNSDGKWIDVLLNDQINDKGAVENISLGSYYIRNTANSVSDKYTMTIVPIIMANDRIGSVVMYRSTGKYKEEELAAVSFCTAIITMIMRQILSEAEDARLRSSAAVKSAIGSLTYSELEAVVRIFDELGGGEGPVIASRIAEKTGVTRSVIVSALRKLEIAGILESRSLGMKGTYIKVNNGLLMDELSKLK